jgi:hypothetical protein
MYRVRAEMIDDRRKIGDARIERELALEVELRR